MMGCTRVGQMTCTPNQYARSSSCLVILLACKIYSGVSFLCVRESASICDI